MKHTVILLAALVSIGFTSCKKDYICECRKITNDELDIAYPVNSVRKDDAETKCESYQFKQNNSLQKGVDCMIKED
jgi:hypothetical protein